MEQTKLSSIIIMIPYFGKLPKSFQLFLTSCQYNKTIDFLLLTDDQTAYNYPDNIKVVYTSFIDVQNRISKAFDFKVKIDYPFKLCDYRPAYGEIFKDYFTGYDFWGHCDIDLLFGDIRKFYTETVLKEHCKIGCLGHLTIYRNIDRINRFYKQVITLKNNEQLEPYKTAYTISDNIGFDEWMFDTQYYKIGEIFMQYDMPVYYKDHFADLTPFTRPFYESYYDPYSKKRTSRAFFYYTWSNGKLFGHNFFKKEQSERLYVHFLKRPMKVNQCFENVEPLNQMLIIPNEIILGKCNLSFFQGMRVIIMNIINPERCKRLFWIICGKIIRFLKKIGLWKKSERNT